MVVVVVVIGVSATDYIGIACTVGGMVMLVLQNLSPLQFSALISPCYEQSVSRSVSYFHDDHCLFFLIL